MKKKNRLLIVSPVFNESGILNLFFQSIDQIRTKLSDHVEIRLLLVDDGSTDNSLETIKNFANINHWVFFKSLAGNFGHQAALIAGLSKIGDWPELIVTMDSDLEHPPELIEAMVQLWQKKPVSVVQTIRQENQNLSWQKRFLSKLFYLVINKLSGLSIQPGQADFILWDAQVIRALEPYLNHIGSLRVFSAWLPGPKSQLSYQQNIRTEGQSKFDFFQYWNLAMNSITRFSSLPLRLMTMLGGLGLLICLVALIFTIFSIFTSSSDDLLILLVGIGVITMSCILLLSFGVLGSYFRRLVFSKNLPLFLVKEENQI